MKITLLWIMMVLPHNNAYHVFSKKEHLSMFNRLFLLMLFIFMWYLFSNKNTYVTMSCSLVTKVQMLHNDVHWIHALFWSLQLLSWYCLMCLLMNKPKPHFSLMTANTSIHVFLASDYLLPSYLLFDFQ